MGAWLARLALLGFSLVLMAGVGEVLLRVALGPPVVWLHPQEHYLEDPELGYRLAPDQRAHTHDELFETNSFGLRSPELPAERGPGTRRLLALGDSQTAGDGLVFEDTWPAQLAAALDEGDPAHRWEALNAGLSGASPWHFDRLLRRVAERYEIDVVVVALYVNDVTPDPVPPRPLVTTNTGAHRVLYVLKRSALFSALWRTRGPLRQLLRPSPGYTRETRVLTGESDSVIEAGWRAVESHLAGIRNFTREQDLELWLLVLPRRDQVDGSQPGRAYNERAAAIARRLGIASVDVLPAFTRAFEVHGRGLFIPWDGHNSAEANAVVAKELARAILDES